MHHTDSNLPQLRYAPSCRSYVDRDFATYVSTADDSAFERVVGATWRSLRSAASAHYNDPCAVEELVQSTYVAAFNGARAYDREHPVLPWMMGILHNRVRRAQRAKGRRPDPYRLPPETLERDPSDKLVSREFAERVQCEIEQLPEVHRPVVDLHVRLALTPAEIAARLGRDRSTVRTQLARGLHKLRIAVQMLLEEAG